MVFFLRCIPTDFLPTACHNFDQAVLRGLQSILPYSLDHQALLQASLRFSNGGLGLRNSKKHHPAAYFSSFRQTRDLICGFTNNIDWNSTPHFNGARNQLMATIPDFKWDAPLTQKDISASLDVVHKNELFESCELRDKARLNAVSASRASAIFSCSPSNSIGNDSREMNGASSYQDIWV